MKRIGGLFGILILAGLGQAASPSPAAPVGLQAEYTFAEGSGATAGDSSGSGFHAVLQNGTAFAAGRIGFGASFDGQNDFVNLGDNRSLVQNASAATIALWVKPGSVIPSGSFRELVSLSVGATNPTKTSRLAVSLKGDGSSGGQIFLGARSTDTESQKSVTTSGGVAVGTWTHLAGVVDFQNSTLKVFINGIVAATATGVGFASPTTANAPCRNSALGAQDDGVGNHYQGGMDQARIYNRALSNAEVQALASGDTLQAHWKLDDGSGLVASDASGNLHTGTLKNGLETGWIAGGQVAGALQFDGVDDYVQVDAPGILQNVNSATVAAWIKPSSTIPAGSFRELISISVGGVPSDVSRFALALRGDGTAGDVFLGGRASDSETQKSITHDSSLPVGEWVHVAGVANFSQGTLEIYINGLLATSGPVAFIQPATSNNASPSISLGAQDSGGSNRYAGAMDEVRVYGRALTACEVQELAGRDGLQAYWKFDESSGTTAADSSATGLTATLKNGASFVPGKLGNALNLDGVDDYADIGLNLPILKGANAATVAAWINLSSVPSSGAFREIASIAVGGSPSNTSRLALAIKGDGTGADLFLGGRSTDTEAQQTLTADQANIQPGVWRHVAATLDYGHNQLRIYLDGVLLASGNAAFSQPTTPTTAPANGALGAQDKGDSNFNHLKMDELRIYCRVLSAAEIASLAASAAPAPPVLSLVEEGNQQVKLSWTTVPGADFYNLKRSTSPGTGYVTIASSGTTLFTDTGLTNDVTYYYVVTAQNSAGESGISNEIPGRPRVAVPPPPVILVPPTGAYLATSTATVSGTSSSPGLTIRLQVDGQENGVTTSVVVGNWSLVVPNTLAEGSHTLRAMATNGSGTSGLSNSVQIVIDTIAPVVSNPVPQNQSTVFSTTPNISATWSDANIDTSTAEIRLDGNLVTPQTITGTGFTFTPSTPLSLTSHGVTAKVKDLAGNESNTLAWSFTIAGGATDVTPPVISNFLPVNQSILRTPTPTLSASIADAGGSGIDPDSAVLILDTIVVPAQVSLVDQNSATVTFALGSNLDDGPHSALLLVSDHAGNAATPLSVSFSVDTTPPSVFDQSPAPGSLSSTAPAAIAASWADLGSGVEPSTAMVFLDGVAVFQGLNGSTTGFTFSAPPLSGGSHSVEVRVNDRAGNAGSASWSFAVASTGSTSAASILLNSPRSGETYSVDQVPFQAILTGTAQVHVMLNAVEITSTLSQVTLSNGQLSVGGLLVPQSGLNQIDVTAIDAASISVSVRSFFTWIHPGDSEVTLPTADIDEYRITLPDENGFPEPSAPTNRAILVEVMTLVGGTPREGIEIQADIVSGEGEILFNATHPQVSNKDGIAGFLFKCPRRPGLSSVRVSSRNLQTGRTMERTFRAVQVTGNVDLGADYPTSGIRAFITANPGIGPSLVELEEIDQNGDPVVDPALRKFTLFRKTYSTESNGSVVVPLTINGTATGVGYLKAYFPEFQDASGTVVSAIGSSNIQFFLQTQFTSRGQLISGGGQVAWPNTPLENPIVAKVVIFVHDPQADSKVVLARLVPPGDLNGRLDALTGTVVSRDDIGHSITVLVTQPDDTVSFQYTAGPEGQTAIVALAGFEARSSDLQAPPPPGGVGDQAVVQAVPLRFVTDKTLGRKELDSVPCVTAAPILDQAAHPIGAAGLFYLEAEAPQTAGNTMIVNVASVDPSGSEIERPAFSAVILPLPQYSVPITLTRDPGTNFLFSSKPLIACNERIALEAETIPALPYDVIPASARIQVSRFVDPQRQVKKVMHTANVSLSPMVIPPVPATFLWEAVGNGRLNLLLRDGTLQYTDVVAGQIQYKVLDRLKINLNMIPAANRFARALASERPHLEIRQFPLGKPPVGEFLVRRSQPQVDWQGPSTDLLIFGVEDLEHVEFIFNQQNLLQQAEDFTDRDLSFLMVRPGVPNAFVRIPIRIIRFAKEQQVDYFLFHTMALDGTVPEQAKFEVLASERIGSIHKSTVRLWEQAGIVLKDHVASDGKRHFVVGGKPNVLDYIAPNADAEVEFNRKADAASQRGSKFSVMIVNSIAVTETSGARTFPAGATVFNQPLTRRWFVIDKPHAAAMGAVKAETAPGYQHEAVTAHELGHALNLRHVAQNPSSYRRNMMWGSFTPMFGLPVYSVGTQLFDQVVDGTGIQVNQIVTSRQAASAVGGP